MIDYRIARSEQEIETARELFLEYQRELGVDLCFQGFDEELRHLPGKYAPPSGQLLTAYDDDKPVACGALRDLGGRICEIKRIYVRPEGRRRGIARSISERLLDFGRMHGYQKVRLDTLRRLAGAVELYRQLGFQEIAAYNYNPEPDIIYMELSLGGSA